MVMPVQHQTVKDRLSISFRSLSLVAAAGVVMPGLTFLGTRIALLCISLSSTTRGLPSPFIGDVMSTSPGWPPFVVPSFPFWASLPILLGLAVVAIWRPYLLGDAYKPGFVALYLGLAGSWSVLFALSFSGTPGWPRDSLIPGALETAACVVVSCVALVRLCLSARRSHRRSSRKGEK
jgi:hypothetical protein